MKVLGTLKNEEVNLASKTIGASGVASLKSVYGIPPRNGITPFIVTIALVPLKYTVRRVLDAT